MTALGLLIGFVVVCIVVCIVALGIGRLIDYLQDAEDFDREA